MCAWRAHGEPVTCLSSLGGRLFTGSEDGTVRVWDAAAAVAGERNALSRISGRFASGPETPRPLLTLDAYAGPVVGVHATRAPRGGRRHLVTASAGAVCVWDVTDMHVLQVLQTEATRSRGADADAKAPETTEPSFPAAPSVRSSETFQARGDAEVRLDLPPPPDDCPNRTNARATETTETRKATASSMSSITRWREPDDTTEGTNVSSVLERRRRRTSQAYREVSRFRRDDAFTCFAIRERENQILVGTAGGNLLALDVFAPSETEATK
jgi:WD40 repeat protein